MTSSCDSVVVCLFTNYSVSVRSQIPALITSSIVACNTLKS